jgi:hypothetical protein
MPRARNYAEPEIADIIEATMQRRASRERRVEKLRTMREAEGLKANAPALNGTKPTRTNRDPSRIKRKRKAL